MNDYKHLSVKDKITLLFKFLRLKKEGKRIVFIAINAAFETMK